MTSLKGKALDVESLRLLLQHFPLWFREDSDECGSFEGRARQLVERLLKKVEAI